MTYDARMDATHPAPDADRHDPLAPEWLRWLGAIGWRLARIAGVRT